VLALRIRTWNPKDSFDDGRFLLGSLGQRDGLSVESLAFSPDSRLLASGGIRGELRVWDVSTRQEVAKLRGHKGVVSTISFSPDGKLLASGGWDTALRLWETDRWQLLQEFEGEGGDGRVMGLAFSPDGQFLAWGPCKASGEVEVLELTKPVRRFCHVKPIDSLSSLCFTDDGKRLLTISDREALQAFGWREAGQPSFGPVYPVKVEWAVPHHWRVIAQPKGNLVLTFTDGYNTVVTSDYETLRVCSSLTILPPDAWGGLTDCAFSPDGKLFVSTSGNLKDRPGNLSFWNVEEGRVVASIHPVKRSIYRVCYSPNGAMIATGQSSDHMINLYDAKRLLSTAEP